MALGLALGAHHSKTIGRIMSSADYDIAVIGGGLAGLVASIELARAGKKVVLFEKKEYPYHKVCGEYVSNEVLPYLQSLGFDPFDYGAVAVRKLKLIAENGRQLEATLPLGAFGISRYTMDAALAKLTGNSGTMLRTATRVTDVQQKNSGVFEITIDGGEKITATLVIGSWGKRDVLDKKLHRPFMRAHTGYMGVKYHISGDFPADEIGLYLFEGGYCGLSKVEGGQFNLCYLYHRGSLPFRSIEELESKALYRNPALRKVLQSATKLFDAPEVINEISFAPKNAVEDGLLMCGDAAGLITPLCGNGMAMAIRSARMLTECILAGDDFSTRSSRLALYELYTQRWNAAFRTRLTWGRQLQDLFYNRSLLNASLTGLTLMPFLKQWLIKKTHGEVMRLAAESE